MTVKVPTDQAPHTLDFNTDLAERFAGELAEFFGIPLTEARERLWEELHSPGSLVANAWRAADPRTPEEIAGFYQTTDSYAYDLAADHSRIRRREFWDVLQKRIDRCGSGLRILLYGDGIGTDSLALARQGHRVTYFDLPGVTSDFARFRFRKAGLGDRITALSSTDQIPEDTFNAAICIEVLEHLPDPVEAMRLLHRALVPGGIAIITESFHVVDEQFPSHLESNLRFAGRTHQLMEGIGFASTFYNTDPVNYPMEFTKIVPGLPGYVLQFRGRAYRAVDTRLRALRSRA